MDAMAAGEGSARRSLAGPSPAGSSPAGRSPAGSSLAGRSPSGWNLLSGAVAAQAGTLSAPAPFAAGLCRTCFGPAQPGSARCFPCRLHAECAPGSLASVVVPVAYAVKGGPLARSLWLYKSAQPGAGAARRALTALLLVFLREHVPWPHRVTSAPVAGRALSAAPLG
jgi:hypothetical protein